MNFYNTIYPLLCLIDNRESYTKLSPHILGMWNQPGVFFHAGFHNSVPLQSLFPSLLLFRIFYSSHIFLLLVTNWLFPTFSLKIFQSVSIQRVSHNVKFTLHHLHSFHHLHLPAISLFSLLFFFFQTEADPGQVSPILLSPLPLPDIRKGSKANWKSGRLSLQHTHNSVYTHTNIFGLSSSSLTRTQG